MKFTKNKKRIDPRYFLNETVEEENPDTVEEGLMADLFAKMKAKPAEESEEDLASRYLKSVQPHMKGSPDISVTHNPEYAKHFASDLYKEDLNPANEIQGFFDYWSNNGINPLFDKLQKGLVTKSGQITSDVEMGLQRLISAVSAAGAKEATKALTDLRYRAQVNGELVDQGKNIRDEWLINPWEQVNKALKNAGLIA